MEYHYPTCLTIAGSDSSGGAGIQADLKTMSALGIYGMSVVTAITAQNTCGVTDIQAILPHIVKAQLEAVFSDIACDAVKIGMLFSSENIEVILDILDKYSPRFIVLDPVLVSTSGHKLYAEENIGVAMKERLFPKATIITPNTEEASLLSGIPISNEHDMYRAGEVLMKTGCRAVLVKGGHLPQGIMNDILFTAHKPPRIFSSEKVETRNTHGSRMHTLFGYCLLFGTGRRYGKCRRTRKKICLQRIEIRSRCNNRKRARPDEPFFRSLSLYTL